MAGSVDCEIRAIEAAEVATATFFSSYHVRWVISLRVEGRGKGKDVGGAKLDAEAAALASLNGYKDGAFSHGAWECTRIATGLRAIQELDLHGGVDHYLSRIGEIRRLFDTLGRAELQHRFSRFIKTLAESEGARSGRVSQEKRHLRFCRSKQQERV
jgi:hypothetical protein